MVKKSLKHALVQNWRIMVESSFEHQMMNFLVGGHSWSGHSESKSQSNRGNSDFWIIKTDAYGNRNHSLNDPDGDSLTWSISGGPDAGFLVIDPVTGELALKIQSIMKTLLMQTKTTFLR